MTRIFCIALLCLMPSIAFGQSGEQVIDLPETSGKWYLTAVYSSLSEPSQRDRQLYAILRSDARLVKLISQVTFTEWDNDSQFVQKSAWSSYLGTNRPALLLQTPASQRGTGSVVYFASGPHLKTDAFLATSIATAVNAYRTGRDCPRCPTPHQPQPVQPPVQPTIPQVVPNVDVDVRVPDPEPAKEETPVIFVVLASLAGVGFGLYQSLKKENSV
jgi:hypothetical protein